MRRALAGGDLLAARTAAAELPRVDLDEAASLVVLIARENPTALDASAVRFLGRARLERSFNTLDDAQFLVAGVSQLSRADADSRAGFAPALRRLRLNRAARRIEESRPRGSRVVFEDSRELCRLHPFLVFR